MKIDRFALFLAITVFLWTIVPKPAAAISFLLPFGGKVLKVTAPPVVCPGEGPITLKPAGLSPAGPYAATANTLRFKYFTIKPGSWIIGLYSPTLLPICYIPATPTSPPIPVPAFPIIMFGVSLPDL